MAFIRNNNGGNGNNNGRRHNNNYNPNNRHRHHNGQQSGSQNAQGGPKRYVNRINQVFDSSGPDGRVRGTAAQLVEKYSSLARDYSANGDRVLMFNYLQHAEHYQRLLTEITEENTAFERERENARQQQMAQPVSHEAASEGDAQPLAVSGSAEEQNPFAPREPRPYREPRHQRPPQDRHNDRRNDRHQERNPRPDTAGDLEDTSSLPSFLQMPPARPVAAEQPAVPAAAPAAADTPTVAVSRTPRARRVAKPSASDDAAVTGDEG